MVDMALIVDSTTDALKRYSRALKDTTSINKAISAAVSKLFRTHFRSIGSKEKNRFGRPSTFWSRMVNSVRPMFTDRFAAVEMNRAIAQRYFGGVIRPTGSKRFLTIPVSKESYGRKAADFHGLFVFRYKDVGERGSAFLAKSNRKVVLMTNSGPQKREKITLLYQLLARVRQKPNKSILPTNSEIAAETRYTLNAYLQRKGVL